MTNHPNRNWRNRWQVDLAACCATHKPTGIIVTFEMSSDGDYIDSKVKQLDKINEMLSQGGITANALARLMREAGDIYKEHLDER